jgi:flavodoxin
MKSNLHIRIAYYTGTGGTAMVAQCFARTLTEKGNTCTFDRITHNGPANAGFCDMLFLLFPVHASNAPAGVYQWLQRLTAVNKTPAVVISVSGGGEVSPNTACRVQSIHELEKKRLRVIYDRMLVMPREPVHPHTPAFGGHASGDFTGESQPNCR